MKRLGWAILSAGLLTPVAGSMARAQAVDLVAHMTNGQEVPPAIPMFSDGSARPVSFGFATFSLNADRTSMTMVATIHNIDITGLQTADPFDNLLAAHIHGGAPPGANAPVRWGFFGMPDSDVMPSDLVVTPFADGVGGTFTSVWNQTEGNGGTTLTEQLPNILGGLSYLNFHTEQFRGGEIRGQLQVVPEPGTVLLLATGLAGLGLVGWRRRGERAA